ncbi:MAG: hypothetical protein GSR84_07015 [Desulfurococcales archaeon]|nr:hypothetical protein [Desulfurococcales archaeon]
MKTGIALAIIILTLLTATPIPSHSDTVGECTLRIAAVSTGGGGVLGNISVRVTPGEGRVYISTSPATEIDTQGAARIAAFTATLILGLDIEKYDFYYRLEAPSIIVGGPSAGAAMTLATIAALSGIQCRTPNVITGMIYPDSTIGPVGGLKDKLKAVAEGGGTLFIVPKGQLVYTSYERVVQRIGPLAIVRTVPVQVNLSEEGEKLGVKVREAGSIWEASNLLLGINLEPSPSKPGAPQGLDEVYNRLKGTYEAMKKTGTGLEEVASRAEEHYKAAQDLAGHGLYFPATREMVDAIALLQASTWIEEAKSNNYNVTPLLEEAIKTVNQTTSMLEGIDTEAGGLASIYTWMAASNLRQAQEALDNGSLPRVITITGPAIDYSPLVMIAYAKTMAEYASLLASLDWPKPQGVNSKTMIVASLGKAVTAYASTLFAETGAQDPNLDTAAELVVSASAEPGRIAKAYLSLAGVAMATAAIHNTFDGETLMPYAEKLAYSLAGRTGSQAAAALLQAYEYYKEQGDTERAWTYLDLSILASWMQISYNEETSQIAGPTQQPQATATVTRTVTITEETGDEEPAAPSLPGAVATGLLLGLALGVIVGVSLSYSRRG